MLATRSSSFPFFDLPLPWLPDYALLVILHKTAPFNLGIITN